jgi:hypothetical protein
VGIIKKENNLYADLKMFYFKSRIVLSSKKAHVKRATGKLQAFAEDLQLR